MVTHELKTPLAGIRLLAEMLESGRVRDEAKAQEYFARISGESTRLSTLIENVLDLGRLERGERSYRFERVDLAQLVRDVIDAFEPLLHRDSMRIDFVRDGEASESMVDLDRHAITQALINVLDNARKYAATGERIAVRVDGTTLRVRDFGCGVPLAQREVIFSRFERGPAQRDGSIPGVGIGLHLARSIVEAHGASLTVEDPQDGEGACFVFRFPPASLGLEATRHATRQATQQATRETTGQENGQEAGPAPKEGSK